MGRLLGRGTREVDPLRGRRGWPPPPSPREGTQRPPLRFARRACHVPRGNRIPGAKLSFPPRGRERHPARSPPLRGTYDPPPSHPEFRGDDGVRHVSFVSGRPREDWKRGRCRARAGYPDLRLGQRTTKTESAPSRPRHLLPPPDSLPAEEPLRPHMRVAPA